MELMLNRDDYMERLIEKPKYNYRSNGDPCHDITHYNEVMDIAVKVAESFFYLEKSNLEMVKVAAAWHDYGRGMECEELGDDHAKISALCLDHDLLFYELFNYDKREIIKKAIENHRTEADCDSWLTAIIKVADLACVRSRERIIERCIGHYFYIHKGVKGHDFADNIYEAIDHFDKKRKLTIEKVYPFMDIDNHLHNIINLEKYSAEDVKTYFDNYYRDKEIYAKF